MQCPGPPAPRLCRQPERAHSGKGTKGRGTRSGPASRPRRRRPTSRLSSRQPAAARAEVAGPAARGASAAAAARGAGGGERGGGAGAGPAASPGRGGEASCLTVTPAQLQRLRFAVGGQLIAATPRSLARAGVTALELSLEFAQGIEDFGTAEASKGSFS